MDLQRRIVGDPASSIMKLCDRLGKRPPEFVQCDPKVWEVACIPYVWYNAERQEFCVTSTPIPNEKL